MLAQTLTFLGSMFNLCIDTIYKIALSVFVLFLCVIVIATGFAVSIVALLT